MNRLKTGEAMNAIKFGMVTAMLSFTVASLTSAIAPKTNLKNRIFLTFDDAIKYHDLILALYQQVQPDLENMNNTGCLAAVIIEDSQYIIFGSYEDWEWFYGLKWDYLLNYCPCTISPN